jgi:hypothetical protein
VSVTDGEAVGGRHELDERALTDDLVHGAQPRGGRWPVVDDGIGQGAHRGPRIAQAFQIGLGAATPAESARARLIVHEAVTDQPIDRGFECGQVLDGETLLVLERVHELESRFEIDRVAVARVTASRAGSERERSCHRVTTLRLLTGYAQGGNLTAVTYKTHHNGYAARRHVMEALFALVISLVLLVGLAVAAMTLGADSRPGISDDHTR